jgi:hypothetical protein
LKDALANLAHRREENPHGKEPKAMASVTDPDSRAMRDQEGRSKPNDNVQLAVDEAQGMIVAAQVNDQPEDSGQLTLVLQEVEQTCGRLPGEVSADSGYNTGAELETLETMGVTGYLPDCGENRESSGHRGHDAPWALAAAHSGQPLTDEQWKALPKDGEGRMEKSAVTYDAQKDELYSARSRFGGLASVSKTTSDVENTGDRSLTVAALLTLRCTVNTVVRWVTACRCCGPVRIPRSRAWGSASNTAAARPARRVPRGGCVVAIRRRGGPPTGTNMNSAVSGLVSG